MLKKIMICLITLYFVACEHKKNNIAPQKALFEEDSVLELRLEMDLEKVLHDIGENRAWHEAFLLWNNKKIKIEVRTRGNFRRNPENCNFPPLFLRFDSLTRQKTPFEAYSAVRLVTHCQKVIALYEQITLEEYAIYKNYNLLTEKSVRVRLAHIQYEDSKNIHNKSKKLAFFVEGTDEVAKRLGAELVKKQDTIQYLECNSFLANQMAVFQFMVGNTDWSVSHKHNLDILKFSGNNYVAVPYDFDFSGLIDAPYAAPDPDMHTESVTQRVYRAYCQSDAELYLVLDKFKNKENDFRHFWQSLPYHHKDRQTKSQQYIQNFYEIIQNKDSIQYYFLENCR